MKDKEILGNAIRVPFVWEILSINDFVVTCKLHTGKKQKINFERIFNDIKEGKLTGIFDSWKKIFDPLESQHKLLTQSEFAKIKTGQYHFYWPNIVIKTQFDTKIFYDAYSMDIGELREYFEDL